MAGEAGESGSSAVGGKNSFYYTTMTEPYKNIYLNAVKQTSKCLPLLQQYIQVVTVSMFKFSSQGFNGLR